MDTWWNLDNVYSYRNDNLRALGFKSYRAYLRSPLWASIRERVLQERPECERCRRKATQVHHRAYDPATLRGDILDSLSSTCSRCHQGAERPGKRQAPRDRLENANKSLTGRYKSVVGWFQRHRDILPQGLSYEEKERVFDSLPKGKKFSRVWLEKRFGAPS